MPEVNESSVKYQKCSYELFASETEKIWKEFREIKMALNMFVLQINALQILKWSNLALITTATMLVGYW